MRECLVFCKIICSAEEGNYPVLKVSFKKYLKDIFRDKEHLRGYWSLKFESPVLLFKESNQYYGNYQTKLSSASASVTFFTD